MPGVPWHTQILADQLTLFQPGGTDYAHLITTGTPGFSDLPTALLIPKIAPMAKLHSLLAFALIFISGMFQIGEEKKKKITRKTHQILLCVNDAL